MSTFFVHRESKENLSPLFLMAILLLCSLLFSGCTRDKETLAANMFFERNRPLISLQPMEDLVGNSLSGQTATTFSRAINKRLTQKQRLTVSNNKKNAHEFEVTMQLIQQEEAIQSPTEISISIHLKIVDLRNEKERVILQEILNVNTLLEKPFLDLSQNDLRGEKYRVSPMGLVEAKLARDIATRIEDYVLLAVKGK